MPLNQVLHDECSICGHLESEHRYNGGCDGIVADNVIAFTSGGPVFEPEQCTCSRFTKKEAQ